MGMTPFLPTATLIQVLVHLKGDLVYSHSLNYIITHDYRLYTFMSLYLSIYKFIFMLWPDLEITILYKDIFYKIWRH